MVRASHSRLRMAAWLLACSAGLLVACLNPRPEDFPSSGSSRPDEVAIEPGESDGLTPDVPADPAAPSEPGIDLGPSAETPDAGAPLDAGPGDAGAGGTAAGGTGDADGSAADAGCSPAADE